MSKTAAAYQELDCVIEPRAPFLTPLQSDTVWGMLAWACRWIYGEEGLNDFLSLQSDGSPRLLVSDAFPDKMLPRPLQPMTVTEIQAMIRQQGFSEGDSQYLEALAVTKEWSEQSYLDRKDVFDLLTGATTQTKLLSKSLAGRLNVRKKRSLKRESEKEKMKTLFSELPQRHNIIDRLRGGSLRENGLYMHQEMWLKGKWCIHLRTTYDPAWLRPLFDYVGEAGFGKRASTGKGCFVVRELRAPEPYEQFPKVADANGFMTLSSAYMPAGNEIAGDAYYTLHVKRGKLGAGMPTDSVGGFLKYPVTMCRAGSIFATTEPTRRWYGRLVDDVHREHKEVRHYGFAFPVAGKLFT